MGHKGKQDKVPVFRELATSEEDRRGNRSFPNNMVHILAEV